MTYKKQLYHWRKEHGICVRCGKKPAVNGVSCLDCKEEDAIRQQKIYASMTEEEKEQLRTRKRASLKKLRQKRRDERLCYLCGKPVYKEYSRCYECYLKSKKYVKPRKGFKEIGLCRICGKPVVPGKQHCEEHLKEKREAMQYAASFRKRKKDDKCKSLL